MSSPETIMAEAGLAHRPITKRWTPLRYHERQHDLFFEDRRFKVVPAGRRSGKTELAKRYVTLAAFTFAGADDGWFVCAAPTHDQAKRIFWRDLKKLAPPHLTESISEGELTISFINGAKLSVLGLDKPERVEGAPLDGIVLDEFANMKAGVWAENIRPALSTDGRPPGWAWFTGVPEGRNHYYRLAQDAEREDKPEWGLYTWHSADIIDADEVEAARNDLDPLTFEQEYKGSFVSFTGRAYYRFSRSDHAVERLAYDPAIPLTICFDFNTAPGVAVVLQEALYEGRLLNVDREKPITKVLGEVWIARNSNTSLVCRRLIKDWGDHPTDVLIYGDATGGAKKSSSLSGSDWDIVKQELRPVFGSRLKMRVPKANPSERSRVNAVNSRLSSVNGTIRMLVDPEKAPKLIEDLDEVQTVEGGSGEIDKKADPSKTHPSDAIGYQIQKRHPVRSGVSSFEGSEL